MRKKPRDCTKTRQVETHHNQPMTAGARARMHPPSVQDGSRKVVALQLNQKEQLALAHLGGIKRLKSLLCPSGRCIACRQEPSVAGTHLDAYCIDCSKQTHSK